MTHINDNYLSNPEHDETHEMALRMNPMLPSNSQVSSLPFQGKNTGSNPVGSTSYRWYDQQS